MTDDGPFAFEPNWVVPPGETLQEQMEDMGLTVSTLAKACGMSVETVQGLLDATVEIDESIATALLPLGFSAQLWLNLEKTYRAGLAAGKTVL